MIKTFVFRRGADILVALDAVSGDLTSVTSLSARMRRLPPGRRTVDANAPVAATLSAHARDADGEIPAGWTFSLSAEESEALASGSYLLDAKLVMGSSSITTDPVIINIVEPATL